MKIRPIALFFASLFLGGSVLFAASPLPTVPPPASQTDPTDWRSVAAALRQQRDQAEQKAQDDELQIALYQSEIQQANAKIAELTKPPTPKKP